MPEENGLPRRLRRLAMTENKKDTPKGASFDA